MRAVSLASLIISVNGPLLWNSVTKGLFTRTVNVTVFVSGTFDFYVMCKQHHSNTLNPFSNGTKNGDFDGTCKQGLKDSY